MAFSPAENPPSFITSLAPETGRPRQTYLETAIKHIKPTTDVRLIEAGLAAYYNTPAERASISEWASDSSALLQRVEEYTWIKPPSRYGMELVLKKVFEEKEYKKALARFTKKSGWEGGFIEHPEAIVANVRAVLESQRQLPFAEAKTIRHGDARRLVSNTIYNSDSGDPIDRFAKAENRPIIRRNIQAVLGSFPEDARTELFWAQVIWRVENIIDSQRPKSPGEGSPENLAETILANEIELAGLKGLYGYVRKFSYGKDSYGGVTRQDVINNLNGKGLGDRIQFGSDATIIVDGKSLSRSDPVREIEVMRALLNLHNPAN